MSLQRCYEKTRGRWLRVRVDEFDEIKYMYKLGSIYIIYIDTLLALAHLQLSKQISYSGQVELELPQNIFCSQSILIFQGPCIFYHSVYLVWPIPVQSSLAIQTHWSVQSPPLDQTGPLTGLAGRARSSPDHWEPWMSLFRPLFKRNRKHHTTELTCRGNSNVLPGLSLILVFTLTT